MSFAWNFFRSTLRFRTLLRNSEKFTRVTVAATVSSFGLLAYSLVGAKKAYAENKASASIQPALAAPEYKSNSDEPQSVPMQRFLSFASLEYNGVAYMTPVDFIRCAVAFSTPPFGVRRSLDEASFNKIIQSTPSLSRSSSTFLQDLGMNGVISFTEYMFLLSLVSHPHTGLLIAFRMFDRDMNDEVDINEFQKITRIFCQLCLGEVQPSSPTDSITQTTLLRHLFGRHGNKKLKFRDFSRFIDNLQTELLRVEFDHYSTGYMDMTPIDLGMSMLRFARMDPRAKDRALAKLKEDPLLSGKSITFESYKALYDFLYVLDDFSSALRLFHIAKRSISKDEFQRAARAVTGSMLNPLVVDVIFTLFDADGDGHLSSAEFIECIRGRGMRHFTETSSSTMFGAFRRCVGKQLAE